MHKKVLFIILLLFLVTSIVSCKSSPQEKIIGTWILLDPPDSRKSPKDRLKFLPNKIAVTVWAGSEPNPRDSVTYEIKNNGKTLVTTNNSGKIEELEIVELTDKNLKIARKNGNILNLVRE